MKYEDLKELGGLLEVHPQRAHEARRSSERGHATH